MKNMNEGMKQWRGEFALTKYDFDKSVLKMGEMDVKNGLSMESIKAKYGNKVSFTHESIGENLLLNAGINLLATLLCGGAGTVFSNANARIGVGDSSTAASASQTGLQASTNKTYAAMDVSYPTFGTSQQIVFRATFASGSANYAWQEFCIDNGTTSLNRLVSSQGTKVSGQVWSITVTVTIS